MTDELNELASAYADGETTPEESALVESDNQGQTIVENIRLLSNRVKSVEPQTEAIRETHLAAALAIFSVSVLDEAVTIDTLDPDSTQKIELRPLTIVPRPSASHTKANDDSDDSDPGFTDPKIEGLVGNVVPISSKPRYQWFTPLAGAAALVLVVGAGFMLLASQNGFTNSSDVASSSAVATTVSTAAEARAANPSSEAAGESADAAESESLLVEEESGSESDAGFLAFDVLPDSADLETLGSQMELSTYYESSSCAANVSDPDGGELIGFLPISIDGEPAELLVFTSETGRRGVTVAVVDNRCQRLS